MAERRGLGVKIFADGANLSNMLELADNPLISGFTTNPTLMRKAGVERLRGLRPEGPRPHHRSSGLLRGVFRRLRRDEGSGAPNRLMGGQRLRQDPGDRHPRRQLGPAGR